MSWKGNYKRFHIWRLHHISPHATLNIVSIVVGLLAGLAAVLLKNLVF